MKRLLIYRRDPITDKNILIRRVQISADFVGIGRNGQINHSEFLKLAHDLEPIVTTIEVLN